MLNKKIFLGLAVLAALSGCGKSFDGHYEGYETQSGAAATMYYGAANQATMDLKQDGDIVSLKLNNEWILLNFPLKKEKHTIIIPLKKPENQLMLFAENLGSIPPNTAAISINDNSTVKTFILNSDMKSSESIKIFFSDNNK